MFFFLAESSEKNYFLIKNAKGETVQIKKKTFCWLLNEEYVKLSNDRVLRFQSKKQPNLDVPSAPQQGQRMVNIGEWCQFKYKTKSVVGQVIGFIYLNERTKKDSRYSLNFAAVSDEKVGVLANWFVYRGNMLKFIMIENFIPIKDYKNHVPKPEINSLIYK